MTDKHLQLDPAGKAADAEDRQERQEAIGNLRVTVKALMAVCPLKMWQEYAEAYLQQTEPLDGSMIGLLHDWCTDTLEADKHVYPFVPNKKRWYEAKAMGYFLQALDNFKQADYLNTANECYAALRTLEDVVGMTAQTIAAFRQQVGRTLYGNDAP